MFIQKDGVKPQSFSLIRCFVCNSHCGEVAMQSSRDAAWVTLSPALVVGDWKSFLGMHGECIKASALARTAGG